MLGAVAVAGVFGGGFLADWLLGRGMLRARLYVTAFGLGSAGVFSILAFSTTRLVVAAPLLSISAGLAAFR